MKRSLAALALVLGLAGAAGATQPFAYEWGSATAGRSEPVRLRWREGALTGDEPAALIQFGHWYRLLRHLWPAELGRLRVEGTLYGPALGSGAPALTLRSARGTARLRPPVTDEAIRAVLQQWAGARSLRPIPLDAAYPRLSDDGEWLAFLAWNGGPAELWIGSRRTTTLYRVPTPEGELFERAASGPPVWALDSRTVACVIGRRLCLVSMDQREAAFPTPPDFPVAEFAISPGLTRPIAVRSTTGGLGLVDLLERRFVPIHPILPDLQVMGDLAWSPTGRRLLMRARTAIESLSLRGGATRLGETDERLVVFDLPAQRWVGVAIAATPLAQGRIVGTLWEPLEAGVYLAVHRDEGGSSLLHLALEPAPQLREVLRSPEPIRPIGWRSGPGRGPGPLESASHRLAFLLGEAVALVSPGSPQELARPYSSSELVRVPLPPGPAGGYRGGEEAVITDSEPPQALFLESAIHTQAQPTRRRLVDGLHVTLPLDAGAVVGLVQLAQRERVVDADIVPQTEALAIAAMTEGEDGTARLRLLERGESGRITEFAERDYTGEIAGRQPVSLPVRAESFAVVDPATGLAALAGRFDRWNWERGGIALVVLLIVGIALWAFERLRRGMRRPPTGPNGRRA